MKRAFFSSITLFLVVIIIAAAAFAALQLSALERTTVSAFEAKKVSDREADAKQFASQSLDDALLDLAYTTHGCTPSGHSFCGTLNLTPSGMGDYIWWSQRALNSPLISVSFSVPYLISFSCYADAVPTGYNYAYLYTNSVLVRANSTNASKEEQMLMQRSVLIKSYVAEVKNNTQTCSEAIPMSIAINDSTSLLKNYSIDCDENPTDLGALPCP